MEDLRTIVRNYKDKGMSVSKATQLAGISRRSFYYYPGLGTPGNRASLTTAMLNGKEVSNEKVVAMIKFLLGQDFVDYGYKKVTSWLNQQGYLINKKKVYRLMKEHSLLFKPIKKPSAREFVKYTKVLSQQPFETLEMDIKFIYIHGTGQNALLLTILDTFNRKALVWVCKHSIRKGDVKALIEKLIDFYLKPYDILNRKIIVTIRNDNGSQFIADMVRKCLKDNFIIQEFTRPGTPQQNGHIESFHSILSRSVAEKFEFENINHLREILKDFYRFYNKERIHSSLCYLSPEVFTWAWKQGFVIINDKDKRPSKQFKLKESPAIILNKYRIFELSGEAEAGSAGEQPARNNLTGWNGQGELLSLRVPPYLNNYSGHKCLKKTQKQKNVLCKQ